MIRLGAINAALLFLFGEDEGRRRIDELDKALPKRAEAERYQSGVILAGARARRRAQSPTIEPGDLLRIVEAAGARRRTALSLRDRLLVAVHCCSGLGAGEIRVLRWDDLRWESEGEAWSVAAARGTKRTRLAIFGPAASLMIRHRLEAEAFDEYAFANSRGETLTDRQVRRIVLAACSAAGFPHAARSTLMSASAAYLSAAGLRDHDVAFALRQATSASRSVPMICSAVDRFRAMPTPLSRPRSSHRIWTGSGQVRWIHGLALLNQRLCCARARSAFMNQRYLYYCLPFPLKALNEVTYATTVKHLSSLDVLKFRLPLPPLDEQRAIAAFLDRETERIDALVAKKRMLIERLREYHTALITRTVTRGLPPEAARAAGMDPSPRLKPSGVEWLGETPEHWDLKGDYIR